MSRALLVLATKQLPRIAPRELVSQLGQQIPDWGLAGNPLECHSEPGWLVGTRFFHLVTFLGCSPSLRLEPQADGAFCHIRLATDGGELKWRFGSNSRPPRCPGCKTQLEITLPPEPRLACSHCGREEESGSWDWRRSAGAGRLFLEIHDIHPAEALPTPQLLRLLGSVTGSEWDYFYLLNETR